MVNKGTDDRDDRLSRDRVLLKKNLINLARSYSNNNPAKYCLFLPIVDIASTHKSHLLDPA